MLTLSEEELEVLHMALNNRIDLFRGYLKTTTGETGWFTSQIALADTLKDKIIIEKLKRQGLL